MKKPYLILYQNREDEYKTCQFWDYERFMENVRYMIANPKDYKNVTTYRLSREAKP